MDRLPRGRHGLSPEFVARNQRERLIAGLTRTLYEVGYQKTTVSLIGQTASVSKSDFYKHFESKDDCFFAAYDLAVERIGGRLVEECKAQPADDWPARVRAGLESLLDLLATEPALASIFLVEGLRAGRGIYDRSPLTLYSLIVSLRVAAESVPVFVFGLPAGALAV